MGRLGSAAAAAALAIVACAETASAPANPTTGVGGLGGRITGVVIDTMGNPLPNIRIHMKPTETQVAYPDIVTAADGTFVVVARGKFILTAAPPLKYLPQQLIATDAKACDFVLETRPEDRPLEGGAKEPGGWTALLVRGRYVRKGKTQLSEFQPCNRRMPWWLTAAPETPGLDKIASAQRRALCSPLHYWGKCLIYVEAYARVSPTGEGHGPKGQYPREVRLEHVHDASVLEYDDCRLPPDPQNDTGWQP